MDGLALASQVAGRPGPRFNACRASAHPSTARIVLRAPTPAPAAAAPRPRPAPPLLRNTHTRRAQSTLHYIIHRHVFRPNKFWAPRVALRALLRTAREVATAMAHLHACSVVHGDLRPHNVLLCSATLDRRGFTAKVGHGAPLVPA